jgi:hypothetical protein
VPLELSSDDEDIGGYTAEQQHEHEAATKVRTCEVVQLGQWEMDTWYFSPLPEGYNDAKVRGRGLRKGGRGGGGVRRGGRGQTKR